MTFKPNKSLSESDIREEDSVDFIRDLLKGYGVKPALKKGDKEANIDGFIELLDDENRLSGKITAQVKTVPPSLEGQWLFDCPTSLFGYAEHTNEVVIIMAVDHKNKTVLWKYISRELIEANENKANQDTIRLHFDHDGQMTSANVEDTIKIWRILALQQLKLYNAAPALAKENEALRKALFQAKGIDMTLTPGEIQTVQLFIDTYNDLMNRELLYVKKNLYPDVWKFGIAIYCFEPAKLGYLIYSINNGENHPLIKQVPSDYALLHQMPYEMMSNYNVENPFKTDYRILLRERIKHHVEKFIKYFNEPPVTVPFAAEIVSDYLNKDAEGIIIPKNERDTFSQMAGWLQANVSHLLKPRTRVVYGPFQEVDLFAVYNSIQYLISQGLEQASLPYPSKGKYGNTGYVYDWYNPDGAYVKASYVIDAVENAYHSFITNNFPLLAEKLDNYKGADLIVMNVRYDSEQHNIAYYLLKSDQHTSRRFLFALNSNDAFVSEIEQTDYREKTQKTYSLNGVDYRIVSYGWDASHETLYSNTPLRKTYQKVLKDNFGRLHETLI
ncbi:MAG: hypothetical protein J6T94_03880 [Bacteroidaceae bacterium]|nr:hypothetical protein [Bacteroidaceae bacterium]